MIEQQLDGGVAILTLNRPKQRNAMSAELVAALLNAAERAGQDAAVGAIMLTGAGNGFCAGSDLAGLAGMDAAGRRQFEADSGRAARALAELPKPVLAAVKGFAIGGGFTLATACDVVVTEPGAKWSLPEVPIGLFPAWGLGSVSARVGPVIAKRLCWGVETLTGVEAQRIGLADHLAETDVLAESLARAKTLAALPRAQSAAVKTYFLSNPGGEAADWLANRLFGEAASSREADATFTKFGSR